jgi:hypothetical protein
MYPSPRQRPAIISPATMPTAMRLTSFQACNDSDLATKSCNTSDIVGDFDPVNAFFDSL